MPFDCCHKSTDCCEKGMCHEATGEAWNTSDSGFVALMLKYHSHSYAPTIPSPSHHPLQEHVCLSANGIINSGDQDEVMTI